MTVVKVPYRSLVVTLIRTTRSGSTTCAGGRKNSRSTTPKIAVLAPMPSQHRDLRRGDRKSTRLNSSHVEISYAVFCLKKKKKQKKSHRRRQHEDRERQ